MLVVAQLYHTATRSLYWTFGPFHDWHSRDDFFGTEDAKARAQTRGRNRKSAGGVGRCFRNADALRGDGERRFMGGRGWDALTRTRPGGSWDILTGDGHRGDGGHGNKDDINGTNTMEASTASGIILTGMGAATGTGFDGTGRGHDNDRLPRSRLRWITTAVTRLPRWRDAARALHHCH